jgi:hypothetical protein
MHARAARGGFGTRTFNKMILDGWRSDIDLNPTRREESHALTLRTHAHAHTRTRTLVAAYLV